MMTVKSDDVTGRVKVYEALVKGEDLPKPSVPESFRVVIKEFQALGLDITVLDKDGKFVELKELEEAEKDTYVPDTDLESEILKEKEINEKSNEKAPSELENELDDFDEMEENEIDEEPTDEELKSLEGEDN